MNKYGKAAVIAVKIFINSGASSPGESWKLATIELFGAGTSSQKKSCPKCAFLGLCEEGMIKGINKGNYTSSNKNKFYAISAIGILKANPGIKDNPTFLWEKATRGKVVKHNNQMDVVIALWINEQIIS